METTVEQAIEPADRKTIAEAILEEYKARKERRKNLERQWDEIDRQLRMEPETSHKMGVKNGAIVKDPHSAWMPEIELPLQAGAQETLLSDVRRLRYPSNGDWFSVRAALTEDYFESFSKAGSPFLGERGENFDGVISQDDADKLVQGNISNWHQAYDFRGNMDLIDSDALTYGVGVGRLRRVRGRILGPNARQVAREGQFPCLVPRSIKCVYFDDSRHNLLHEGFALGPSTLQDRTQKLADLQAAAEAGEGQGYIKDEIKRLQKPDKNGMIDLVELEGDFAFDRGMTTVILQDVCLTIAKDQKSVCLVQAKEGEKFSTYLAFNYHLESTEHAYASAPLLKGMPIAKAAAQALNRVIEASLLRNFPPLQYSPDDPELAGGGPHVAPKAMWKTVEGVRADPNIGGDPTALFQIFSGLIQMYEDVATGVTPSRRGAQTKSHTTAFAKSIEEQRGVVRTVDYVRSTLHGQMTRLLDLEYRIGLEMMGSKREVTYIQEWREFVELSRKHLPDIVHFEAIGSDAPAEEQQRVAEKLSGGQAALQLDATAAQLGHEPSIKNIKPMVEEMLRETGWHNLEELMTAMQEAAGAVPQGEPALLEQPLELLQRG